VVEAAQKGGPATGREWGAVRQCVAFVAAGTAGNRAALAEQASGGGDRG
jgi:hypothetical protein